MHTLAEPAYDGRVMFCGEHTIPEHNASLHGPVISGLREARRFDKDAHLKKVIPGLIPCMRRKRTCAYLFLLSFD